MDDILHVSIAQLGAQIRKGEISPVKLIEMTLEAIDQCEPQLNAFITVFREGSLESARQAEVEIRGGKDLGPLHGIPIALKDIICVEGNPQHSRLKLLFGGIAPVRCYAGLQAEERGSNHHRQDQSARICFRRDNGEPALWGDRQPVGHLAGCRADRVAVQRQPLLRAAVPVHWAATPAVQSVSRRRYVGMWG